MAQLGVPGLALWILLFGLLASSAAAAEDPGLAGHWRLDPERSDSPERASRQALRDLRRLFDPRGQSGPRAERQAEAVLAPIAPPRQQVIIELDEPLVTFHVDDRPPRSHYTDGRAAVIDSRRPEQSIAAWEDGRLFVERTFDGGTRIIESWWLEGDRLRADFEARNSLLRDPVRFSLRFVAGANGGQTP